LVMVGVVGDGDGGQANRKIMLDYETPSASGTPPAGQPILLSKPPKHNTTSTLYKCASSASQPMLSSQ